MNRTPNGFINQIIIFGIFGLFMTSNFIIKNQNENKEFMSLIPMIIYGVMSLVFLFYGIKLKLLVRKKFRISTEVFNASASAFMYHKSEKKATLVIVILVAIVFLLDWVFAPVFLGFVIFAYFIWKIYQIYKFFQVLNKSV